MRALRLSALTISVVAALGTARAQEQNPHMIICGPGSGGGGDVVVFSTDPPFSTSFFPFNPSFPSDVPVAAADFNGDGRPDVIVASGSGSAPHVKVFDGKNLSNNVHSFSPFTSSFMGGVSVAVGDVNNDGTPDIVVAPFSDAAAHVQVYSGGDLRILHNFFAFAETFTGGVSVAAGDINGDGYADIIVGAGPGSGPHVKVFSGQTGSELASFFAYAPSFSGGVNVAAGDINNDGFTDIITGVFGEGAPHVKVFNGATQAELASFFAYDVGFTGGVRVASGDVNGDGFADIITGAGPGGGPQVKIFSGSNQEVLANFFAFDPSFTGGIFVATAEILPPPSAESEMWVMR